MNPVVFSLLLLGYGLAVPVLMNWRRIPTKYRANALIGHQLGVAVAALGWLVRGKILIAGAHLIWLIAARVLMRVRPVGTS